jgi:hypothetical protein
LGAAADLGGIGLVTVNYTSALIESSTVDCRQAYDSATVAAPR